MKTWERLYTVLKETRGIEETQDGLKIPSEMAVEVYINAGKQLMPITKVQRVKSSGELWIVYNQKAEVYYFPADFVVGLKVNDSGKHSKDGERSAGFTP